jgi:hypothetical protein
MQNYNICSSLSTQLHKKGVEFIIISFALFLPKAVRFSEVLNSESFSCGAAL